MPGSAWPQWGVNDPEGRNDPEMGISVMPLPVTSVTLGSSLTAHGSGDGSFGIIGPI